MRKTLILAITGALSAAFIPITTLLVLDPSDYANFSVIYLVFAFSISLQLSLVSDPWARVHRRSDTLHDATGSYISVALQLSLLAGASAFALSHMLENRPLLSALYAGAIITSTLRSAIRYKILFEANDSSAVASDILSIAGSSSIIISLMGDVETLELSALAWLIGSTLSLAAFPKKTMAPFESLPHWIRRYRTEIRAVLPDSLLMDIGAIGAPFIVAGLLPAQSFGSYRAISNVALPVRLVLDPLRPKIVASDIQKTRSPRMLFFVTGVAAFMGTTAAITLVFVVGMLPSNIGTLSSLTPLSAQTGIFVATAFVGHYAYIGCRANCTSTALLRARIFQTIAMIALPPAGAVAFALPGAAWGFAIASGVSAAMWLRTLRSYRN